MDQSNHLSRGYITPYKRVSTIEELLNFLEGFDPECPLRESLEVAYEYDIKDGGRIAIKLHNTLQGCLDEK